jgi:cell wall-associated NlpC family hydrolase
MSGLALYLARPLDEFSMLTGADRRALAALLRRGDVLLSAGNSRCAEIVKRLTQSTWSHVSIYVGPMQDEADPRCVVEADIVHGVRLIRLSDLNAHRVCVLRPVGLDDAERGRLVQSVLRHIGSAYDLAHAWQLARELLLRRMWARLRSLPTKMRLSATRFICSSLIAQAFAVIGYSILPGDAIAVERGSYQSLLVPADFERASMFAVVWPAIARDEGG